MKDKNIRFGARVEQGELGTVTIDVFLNFDRED
jgi:hypothetical protein